MQVVHIGIEPVYLWDAGVNSRHSTCQTVALALKTPILNCLLDFIRPPIFIITNTCVFKVCGKSYTQDFLFLEHGTPHAEFLLRHKENSQLGTGRIHSRQVLCPVASFSECK